MRYQLVEEEASPQPSKERFQIVEEAPESTGRYIARGVSQIGKGIAKATPPGLAMEVAHAVAPSIMATPEKRREELEQPSLLRKTRTPEELEKELDEYKKHYNTYQEWVSNMPTIERLSQIGEEYTGLPLASKYKEQAPLELAGGLGRLATGSLAQKAVTGAAGGATTAGLQAAGVPESAADIAATLISPAGVSKASQKLGNRTSETLPSGLSKPRAIDAKFPEKAFISKERQAAKLAGLNEEAANLTKETLEKRLPISKQIEEGFDFEKQFQDRFSKVKSLADDFRPEIEIAPVQDLMNKTVSKYEGIPMPHEDAKKILKEVSAFERGNYNTKDLSNALKIYRSNNQKIKSIYEQSRLLGSKQEYVDWLLDYNRAIGKSIKDSFPEDSAFVKMFEDANKDFAQYKNALKAQSTLKPLLGANPTPANLVKLSSDPKTMKRLSLAIGDEGASEIAQIAKDLKTAKEAIKKIPKGEISKLEKILPLGFVLDVSGLSKDFIGAYSARKLTQYGYGRWLVDSKSRQSYSEAIKSIIENDPKKYAYAVSKLGNFLEEER